MVYRTRIRDVDHLVARLVEKWSRFDHEQGRRNRGDRWYMYPPLVEEGGIACICTPRVDRSNGVISPLNA